MPNDYVTLNALAEELNDTLSGGKIRRICQPEQDEITVSVFNGKTNLLLVMSANPNSPRLHLTSDKKENPYVAPPLLMVLRKYIGSAVIKKVRTLHNDRIIAFDLTGKNDFFDEKRYTLLCELMGRYSNIILLDENNTVLDALHKLIPDENQKRCILCGAKYTPPEQSKTFMANADLAQKLHNVSDDLCIYLAKNVSGVSTPSAAEIIKVAKNSEGNIADNIAKICREFANIRSSEYYYPCYNAEKTDYFAYHAEGAIKAASLNEAADVVFSEKDRLTRLKAKAKTLDSSISALIKKTQKSIELQRTKLAECEKTDELKLQAELITCNLHCIEKGAAQAEVYDYYQGCNVTVKLDPTMPANVYAQKLYKKYAKLKRGKEITQKMLEQNSDNLQYYQSIKAEIALAENLADLDLISEEMSAAGLIKTQNKKHNKNEVSLPLCFNVGGFKVLCGKNGLQNDSITFKSAKEQDIWLHAAKSHGAHVVILCGGMPVPDETLAVAAEIAAYYSEHRNNSHAEIDYTKRRNVKRHPCGKTGLVIYTDYCTVNARPNSHAELLAK